MIKYFYKKNSFILSISASLIIAEFYFFLYNSRALISSHYLIFNTLFLFLFSIIFFLILFKFFDKLGKNISEKKQKILTVFFFSFIYLKVVQIPFFYANTQHLKTLIALLLNKILAPKIIFLIPFLKILLPFFLIFLIIYLLIPKKKTILINFILAFSFVFFIYMSNDIYKRVWHMGYNKIYPQKKISNKQVVWFILDEYDPSYLNNKDLELENINNLTKISVTHYANYPPSSSTLISVPSTLMGIKSSGYIYENYQYKILNEKKKKINFEFNNTLFKTLNDENFSFSIFSEVIKYCNILKIKNNCVKDFNKLKYYFDGIINIYLPIKYFKKIGEFSKKRNAFQIDKLNSFISSDNSKLFISKRLNIPITNLTNIINDKNNLIFFHLFLPHTDTGKDDELSTKHIRDYFNIDVNTDDQEYLLNLKYTDILIKQILKIIDNNGNNEIMLLLTSDHWRRIDSPKKPKPSLFIVKIKNDETKLEIFKKGLNINIPELIKLYLKDEIKTHFDIKVFLEKFPKFDPQEIFIE